MQPNLRLSVVLLPLAAAFLTPVASQVDVTPPTVAAAWREFATQNPGCRAEWNVATGTPAAIWGRGFRVSAAAVATPADARRVARAFVDSHRALLGLGTTAVRDDIVQRVGEVWVMVLQQEARGLPVHGARVDVRLRVSGEVALFGAVAFPVPDDFDPRPRLDAALARAAAVAHLRVAPAVVPLDAPGARLLIWGDVDRAGQAAPRLAWEVKVHAGADAFVGRAFVDARTGAVLQTVSDRHACGCVAPSARVLPRHVARVHGAAFAASTAPAAALAPAADVVSGRVVGFVNTDRLPTAALTEVPLPRLKVITRAGGQTWGQEFFTAADGSFSVLTDTTASHVTVEFHLDGNRLADVITLQGSELFHSVSLPNRTSGHVITFGSAGAGEFERAQTTTYWHTDDVSTWAAGVLGRARIATLDLATATVNDPRDCNAFYAANTFTYRARSSTCSNTAYRSIIYHEWGHGLDDVYGGISTNDGLSEGNADVVACLRGDDAMIGPGFYRDGRTQDYLRTATNTRRYPVAGGVHEMGELWMGCAWDMRAALIARLGAAAGKARAEMLLLGSIAGNGRSLRAAVRDVFVLDDNDADLCNGTPNYAALAPACIARSVPYPEAPCVVAATVTAFSAGCPGTGTSPVSWSANAAASGLSTTSTLPGSGVYAMSFFPQRPLTVAGFALLTRSASAAPTTVSVALYDEDVTEGVPYLPLAGPVTLAVGTAAAWYGASFAAPVPLGPMARYYLVVRDVGPGDIVPPIADAGVDVPALYASTTGGAWGGPHRAPFAYRLTSPPTPRPFLGSSDPPRLGETFGVHLHGAPAGMPVSLWLGGNNTTWFGRLLPLDFGPLGAPGCAMLVSWDVSLTFGTSSVGTMHLGLGLPSDVALGGLRLYLQAAVIDLPANRLGVTVSNGLVATLGR
jgi:hypothetical protein